MTTRKGTPFPDDELKAPAPVAHPPSSPMANSAEGSFLPALFLTEVERILELFCTALAGRELRIRRLIDAPADLTRMGPDLPLSDGKAIYLPEKTSGQFQVSNFDFYLVLAAHQAGYTEFGTFDFDIDVLLRDDVAAQALKAPAARVPVLSHFDLFLASFSHPRLARDIFFAVEDGRVDYLLHSQYGGLAGRLRQVLMNALTQRPLPESLPPLEATVECLVRLSLGEEPSSHALDMMRPLWKELARIYNQILRPGATVIDSAAATIRIYSLLADVFGAVPVEVEGGAVKMEPPQMENVQNYIPAQPVPFRGQTDPGRVQIDAALDILQELEEDDSATEGLPMTAAALEELLKRGVKIKILNIDAEELPEKAGLFATDLKGVLQEKLKELSPEEKKKLNRLLRRLRSQVDERSRVYFYDEWDYLIDAYRPSWCKLWEIPMEMGPGAEVARIRRENAALIGAVKRNYQRIRPEMLRKVKRLPDGEDIVLDHAIDAVIDRKAGLTPSFRVYQKRERRIRDIATCILLDVSASTDEWVVEEPEQEQEHQTLPSRSQADAFSFFAPTAPAELQERFSPPAGAKRIIDVEREALIVMAEAMESLGDEYAIFGFSGYGRENVEFLLIKEYSERYSERVRRRIEAIEPRKSTRMGPAIRHCIEKLSRTGKKMKILLLLSDGYPQDFDYGPDRSSRAYGLHDTAMALQEARRRNIHTFCITIDQAGNDYLYEMCSGRDYFIVRKPSSLPKVLPGIYRKLAV